MTKAQAVRSFVEGYFMQPSLESIYVFDERNLRYAGEDDVAHFLSDFMRHFHVKCRRFEFRHSTGLPLLKTLRFLHWRLKKYPSIEVNKLTLDDLIEMAELGELTEEKIFEIEHR